MMSFAKCTPTVLAAAICFISSAWAQEATQTPQSGPPPEPFTIEGLHIGMTPAEAEVSAPDLDLREGESGSYRTRFWHDPVVMVAVDSDGKIRTIEITCVAQKGAWPMN